MATAPIIAVADPIVVAHPLPYAESDSSDPTKAESDQSSVKETSSLNDSKAPLAATTRPPSRLVDLFRFSKRKSQSFDLDSIATQPSVFDDAEVAKYNAPHPKWEGLQYFDPSFRWTWREERALVRKMDLRVAAWAIVMFFALDLDRENISQANSDNLLPDLGMTSNDYNLGNTLFKLAFLSAELPSQLISKKVGADRWVPSQLVIFSLFSGAQFFMMNRSTFLALRFLIGLFQGGFIPDTILWLSYFYTTSELPLRLAFFWVSNYAVKIISPFIALGLLELRGLHGREGWRWLFLLEGIFTLTVGTLSFWHMPASPTRTKNWLYKNGWFTENEQKIIVNRVIRDDPGKGGMHVRQGIDWSGFRKSLADYDLWPMYVLGLVTLLHSYPLANYLTIQLRAFGFSTLETNALSIPSPVLGLILLLGVTMLSELVDHRSFIAMTMSLWAFPFYLALSLITADRWTYWALASLEQAYPYTHALQVAWISRNSGSVRSRTISASVYNMAVQISSIIGANVYQTSDSPDYRKGNLAMAMLALGNCFLYTAIYFYYRGRNKSRERKWSAMSKEEQLNYLATTKDEGNRRLDFRFQL